MSKGWQRKPSKPGWYWWRTKYSPLEPTEVITGDDGRLWIKLAEASYIPVSEGHGEWHGPKEVPT